jgi:hypothetical protein
MRTDFRSTRLAILAGIATVAALAGAPPGARADVNVGVTIGVPPAVVVAPVPPPVIVTPPQLVIVPGSPVYYAPAIELNYFVYGGRHWAFHGGHWFVTSGPGLPWARVTVERVPRPVLGVPFAYYKVPPGHAKKAAGPPGTGHRKGKHSD